MTDAPEWTPVYCYAVRLAADDGWRMHESRLERDAAEAALRGDGHEVAEMRLVSRGASCSDDLSGIGALFAHREGWAYDALADCWRAPGEPVTEPPGAPVRARWLRADIGHPGCGWLGVDLWLSGAHQHMNTRISCSAVFDPLPELVEWLEKVAAGENPRLAIDEEGRTHELVTFAVAGAPSLVRLFVRRNRDETTVPIDAVLPRIQLVVPLWRALSRFDRLPREIKEPWWYGNRPYRLRSTALDALSARL